MSNLKKILAKNLRRLRAQRNLNQDDMAEVLEISLGGYQNYELEKNLPKPDKMKSLATFFDVEIGDLLEDKDGPTFTLSEKTPLSEIITLLHKKTGSIPEDIINMSMNYSIDDGVWEDVRGVFASQKKSQKNRKAKRA